MTTYINSIITVMVVCQVATVLAPDSDSAKKYIRTVCALIVLFTLISPIKYILSISGDISEKITNFFNTEELNTPYDEQEAGIISIMQYVAEKYDTEEISAVIITNEEDTAITEIQLFVPNCPYAQRQTIETEMTQMLEIPVYVFSES